MSGPTREALLKFASKVVEQCLDGCDVDGGDVQDWAVEAGLLIPTEVNDACGEYCSCAEWGFPTTCYKYCEALNGLTDGPTDAASIEKAR